MNRVLAVLLVLSLSGLARADETKQFNENGEEIIPNPSKKWGIAFGGAAAGLWLLAIGTGGAALAKSSAQEGNTAMPPVYTPGLADDAKTGASLATAAYVFIGLAAVATVVDGVIWYECLRKPRVLKKVETERRKASIELTPAGVRF